MREEDKPSTDDAGVAHEAAMCHAEGVISGEWDEAYESPLQLAKRLLSGQGVPHLAAEGFPDVSLLAHCAGPSDIVLLVAGVEATSPWNKVAKPMEVVLTLDEYPIVPDVQVHLASVRLTALIAPVTKSSAAKYLKDGGDSVKAVLDEFEAVRIFAVQPGVLMVDAPGGKATAHIDAVHDVDVDPVAMNQRDLLIGLSKMDVNWPFVVSKQLMTTQVEERRCMDETQIVVFGGDAHGLLTVLDGGGGPTRLTRVPFGRCVDDVDGAFQAVRDLESIDLSFFDDSK